MKRKKIYNPESQEKTSERKIFGGDPTGIFELNDIKYQWAYNLWEMMLNNTWFPKEVDMTRDINDYKHLTDAEKSAYDKVLAQLIFMDSLQTNNIIDNLNPFITAPEINLVLVRQAFEEALHSQSYAVMVDSISTNSQEIYELWRRDMKLKSKNDAIAKVYDELSANPSDMGTAQMIRFIQRDEVTHLLLFQNMINATKKERPELFTKELIDEVYQMFRDAVKLESEWGAYITQGQILGLTDEIIEQYIQHLADKRLHAVGLEKLYNVEHPIKWVENFSQFNDQKTNFFEGNVTNYSKGSLDLDDF